MNSLGGSRGLLIVLIVTIGMAGCKPAILDSTPVPAVDTEVPVIQIPTPVCQVLETTDETDYGYPPVSAEDWVEGPEDALITFTFYGDFLCPYSVDLDLALAKLTQEFPQELRVVFRQLPLQQSYFPALAVEAAGMQSVDSTTAMRHYLFAHQADWILFTNQEFLEWLHPYVEELGLDTAQFDEDILSDTAKQNILDDLNTAAEYQINATPFVLMNNKPYTGIRDEESLREIFTSYRRIEPLDLQVFDQCPDQIIDENVPLKAKIVTTRGELMAELYPQYAPFAVNNFVFLSENGWYDDTPIFHVVPGLLLQAGDPTGTGSGTAGYTFGNEIHPDLSFDEAGMLAMANGGSYDPVSNSSQFIITFTLIPEYNGGYTIFGKIIAGMEILDKFPAVEPSIGGSSEMPERIISIEILEDK